ncbi:hypothetical protein [Streptomyces sp. NPDC016172]|uniref:hypothetical protein n=1 Tax=Streptomyces sp. NPDC016172 TaxID=3364964 RepID=UPI0036F5A129
MKENPRLAAYEYVGPAEIRQAVSNRAGSRITSAADLERFLEERGSDEAAEPFTFVVDASCFLVLAPRRSEHVACAGAEPVLAAGEVRFSRNDENGRLIADYVSNQSTGYCPQAESWAAVVIGLVRAEVEHGTGYTHPIVFRCCPSCHNWNVVKESVFVCSMCDSDLPLG